MDAVIGISVLLIFVAGLYIYRKWHKKYANKQGGAAGSLPDDNEKTTNENESY